MDQKNKKRKQDESEEDGSVSVRQLSSYLAPVLKQQLLSLLLPLQLQLYCCSHQICMSICVSMCILEACVHAALRAHLWENSFVWIGVGLQVRAILF